MRQSPPSSAAASRAYESTRTAEPPAETSSVVYRPTDFEHSVHLDAHSQIVAGNGKIEELGSLAAYACRIASLIGQELGFGPITGIETTLEDGALLIHREAQGDIVAIKPRSDLNLIPLKAQLNL